MERFPKASKHVRTELQRSARWLTHVALGYSDAVVFFASDGPLCRIAAVPLPHLRRASLSVYRVGPHLSCAGPILHTTGVRLQRTEPCIPLGRPFSILVPGLAHVRLPLARFPPLNSSGTTARAWAPI